MVLPSQVCGKGAGLVKLGLDRRRRCEDSSATEEGCSAQPKSNGVCGRVGVATGAGADRIDEIGTPTVTMALVVEIARLGQWRDCETPIHGGLKPIGVPRKLADDISCIVNARKRDGRRKAHSGIGRYRVHYGRNRAQVSVDGLHVSLRHPAHVWPNHHGQLLGSSRAEVLACSQHFDELRLRQLETGCWVRGQVACVDDTSGTEIEGPASREVALRTVAITARRDGMHDVTAVADLVQLLLGLALRCQRHGSKGEALRDAGGKKTVVIVPLILQVTAAVSVVIPITL